MTTAPSPTILARGRWTPDQVAATWNAREWKAPPELEHQADLAVEALRRRSSPSHDGLAGRLAGWRATDEGLELELESIRWALRLVNHPDTLSMTAVCAVRDHDGRWLAGRRAEWLASMAGYWALGAGGSVEIGENPAQTLTRELEEEWQLVPESVSVEALATIPSGLAILIGVATVPVGAPAVPDAEHDEFAWWPADVNEWPEEADARLRLFGQWLTER